MHSDRPSPDPLSPAEPETWVEPGNRGPEAGPAPSPWPSGPEPATLNEQAFAAILPPPAPSDRPPTRPVDSSPEAADSGDFGQPPSAADPEAALILAGQAEERWIQAERAAGGVLWGLIALGSLGGLIFSLLREERSWAWQATLVVLLLLGLLGLWLWRRPVRLQAHLSYRLDAEALTIQRGYLWRHWTSVPRARVQYVDLVSGPIDQRYGLSKLVIHTAGSNHAEVELPGLSKESALALRAELVRGLERESL